MGRTKCPAHEYAIQHLLSIETGTIPEEVRPEVVKVERDRPWPVDKVQNRYHVFRSMSETECLFVVFESDSALLRTKSKPSPFD